MIPPGLWAVRYPVYRMQCAPECALFVPYPSQTIGNEHARTRIKITIILYKTKQTQTVVSQLAHSFNQRARDSSSLERTKIPRRIVRFLVGFSVFWGSAHFCTLFAHRRESRVFPCIVCILCIVSVFSILFSGEQQAGELTPLLGVHLPDNFQHPFGGDLDAVRQIFFYRHRAGFWGADVL